MKYGERKYLCIEMKFRLVYLFVLTALVVLNSACVEKVQPASYQVVHVYTDYPKSFDIYSFRDFGRKKHIQVLLYHKSTEAIIKQVNEKKWESGVDIVVFKNAMDLERLNSICAITPPKKDTLFYQPILIDPYVFHFPNDSVPLFSSYGQVFRNNLVKIDPSAIRDKQDWGNLLGGLIQKYPKVDAQSIYNKILRNDSIEERDAKHLEILPYSMVKRNMKFTFPDQRNKGSIGKVGGMVIIKQAKYGANARILYEYCRQKWWRKKLAKKVHVFPFVDEAEDNLSNTLLYNKVIINWEFIKKVKNP